MKKLSKQVIVFISCVICALAGIMFYASDTKAAEEATLQVASAEGYAGDNVIVTVAIKDNPGMASVEFKLGFDNTVLELVSVTANETVFKGPMVNDTAIDFIGYVYADIKEGVGDTEIYTAEFKILDEAAVGTSTLKVYDLECSNFDGDTVPTMSVDGSVRILCKHLSTKEVETKAATCKEAGSKNVVCNTCNELVEIKKVEALGHKYGEYVITTEATCTESGVSTSTCSACGDKVTKSVEALGHKYGEYVITTEATCTDLGVSTSTCSACGDKVTKSVEALGHKYGEYVITTEATCTESGVSTSTCSACGDKVTKSVEALGHKYGEYVITTEATCTESGVSTSTCSACGDKVTKSVEALGHKYGEYIVTKEPTATEHGESKATCSVCGDEKILSIPVIEQETPEETTKPQETTKTENVTTAGTDEKADGADTGDTTAAYIIVLVMISIACAALVCRANKKNA